MGNLCPWCKTEDDSQSNNNLHNNSTVTNSQRSLTSSEENDRTPLLSKSNTHNQYHRSNTPVVLNAPTNVEPSSSSSSSFLPTIVPPPPPIINNNHTESTIAKVPSNETVDSSMAIIVDRMLPDLIDVGGWGTGPQQTNTNTQNFNAQNDYLKPILTKSLQSTRVLSLPDVGVSNLSTLLSNRPISSDICHFVAHTSNELSRLLIDEIKIVHKEDLVVTFE